MVRFVEWRAAAAGKISVDAWTGFPTGKRFFPSDDLELAGKNAGGSPEAGTRVLAATPAMAIRDRTDELAGNFVTYLTACTGTFEH